MSHSRTLLLNQWYFPIKVVSWQDAVTLLYLEKVDVVVTYDDTIRSPTTSIKTPAVVRLRMKTRTTKRGVKFSRVNVFTRDSFTCQYCGTKLAMNLLTYDHVIPRSRGGRTQWDNIVTACYGCNSKKGDRTPDEASMHPFRKPERPKSLPLTPPRIDVAKAPVEWRDFCHALTP